MLRSAFSKLRDRTQAVCFWLVVAMFVLAPIEYLAILNAFGPSTRYFEQAVASSVRGPDGVDYIYVGDEFRVTAMVIRHKLNGSCRLSVDRVRQNVGGKFDGKRSLIQHVDQAFVGTDEFRRTSWPIPPIQIFVTPEWFDDPEAQEQPMDVFVVARYHCNFLDDLIPRYLQDPKWPNEGPHTRVVLRRSR